MRDHRQASNLTRQEHDRIIRIAINAAREKMPVIAGAGSIDQPGDPVEQGCRGASADALGRAVLQQADAVGHTRIFVGRRTTGLPITSGVPSRAVPVSPTIPLRGSRASAIHRLPRRRRYHPPLVCIIAGAGVLASSGDDATALAFSRRAATAASR
jgi:hypothetical protein